MEHTYNDDLTKLGNVVRCTYGYIYWLVSKLIFLLVVIPVRVIFVYFQVTGSVGVVLLMLSRLMFIKDHDCPHIARMWVGLIEDVIKDGPSKIDGPNTSFGDFIMFQLTIGIFNIPLIVMLLPFIL